MSDKSTGQLAHTLKIPDSPDVKLIELLLEKSRTGKISWSRTPDKFSTFIAQNELAAEFSITESSLFATLSSSRSWSTFTIKANGEPILSIDKGQSVLLSLAGLRADPVVSAADDLFRFIDGIRMEAVQKAVQGLENL